MLSENGGGSDGDGDGDDGLIISACCKHFTAYDLEKWGGFTRYNFNAVVRFSTRMLARFFKCSMKLVWYYVLVACVCACRFRSKIWRTLISPHFVVAFNRAKQAA